MISHWLGAHHARSRMLGGHWPLSCDRLDEETYGGAKNEGLNTHSWAQTLKKNICTLSLSIHSFLAVLFLYGQFDGDCDAGSIHAGMEVISYTYSDYCN